MRLQLVNVKSAHERIEFDVSVDKDGVQLNILLDGRIERVVTVDIASDNGAVTIKHGALADVRRATPIVVLPVLELEE